MNARAHRPHTDDAAPRDLRTEGGGGKIYPVDPAAWEHFKAVMAQQQDRPRQERKPTGIKRGGNGRLDADLQRKVDELKERARQRSVAVQAETKELDMTKKEADELTETAVREAHGRFSSGESVKALANELGIPWQTLRGQFRRYGLPAGRADVKKRKPAGVRARTPEPQPQPEPTAVVPVQETAVAPAPNGHAVAGDLTAVSEQLAALQALLSQAEAKSVSISGRIRLELTAEVEL